MNAGGIYTQASTRKHLHASKDHHGTEGKVSGRSRPTTHVPPACAAPGPRTVLKKQVIQQGDDEFRAFEGKSVGRVTSARSDAERKNVET